MAAARRAGWTACASALAMTVALAASAAAAEVREFDLRAQPLSSALRAYGQAAGRQLIFSETLVRGAQAPPVQGRLEADEALRRLLADSGLTFRRAPSGGLMIVRQEDAGPQSAAAADAAAAESSVAELVVTGTRIQGAAPVGARPLVLGREAIALSGRGSAADVLRVLPQVTSLGFGEEVRRGAQSGPTNLSFASGVNLRGLGVDATLVQVNGHRLASSNEGGMVDTSQIPLLALERVEVLPDGASALYGADAVAGVVNFVLRRDLDGAESTARYGFGDGFDQLNLGQAFGRRWTGGQVFLAVDYLQASALKATDRPYFTSDLRAFGGPDLRTNNGVPGTITVGPTTYAIPADLGRPVTAADLVAGTSNRRDRWADADVVPETEKISGALTFSQELTPRVSLFLDALASRRDASRRDAGSEVTLTVPRSNAFFVSPVPNAASTSILYNYAAVFGGQRIEVLAEDVTVNGGLRVRLPRDWQLTAARLASRSRMDFFTDDTANSTFVARALADSNPATAFNPFCGYGCNPPAVVDGLRGFNAINRRFSLNSLNLDVTGSLLALPGGPLQLAAGFESREERLSRFDPLFTSGEAPRPTVGSRLSRRVEAVYAELRAPLVADGGWPLVESLTLSAAVRGERYSDLGDTWNPKVGLEWRPIADLRLSGSWGTSFKPPRLPQLDTGTNSIGVTSYGLPSGPVSVIQLSGNGDDLQPEEAETLTVGVTWTPAAAPGLRASLDYFDVDYRNRLLRPTAAEVITALSGSGANAIVVQRAPSAEQVQAYYADPLFGANAPRPPPSSIFAVIDFRFANLGQVRQSGLDARVDYSRPLGRGTVALGAAATYLTRYEVTRIAGGPTSDDLNTSNNPVDLRARASASYRQADWVVAASVNHTGDYRNTTLTPNQRVKAWTTLDLHLGWRPEGLVEGLRLALDVRNALDADPPRVAHVSGPLGYDPEQANALGRVVSLTLEKSW